MKKQLKQYYRSVYKCLPVKRKQKQQILHQIRQSVEGYLAENPLADMPKIIQHFGKPEEIASTYVENMTTREILKRFHVRKSILTVICSVAAIVLLVWGAAVAISFINELDESGGFVVVDPVVEINETEEVK